MKIEPKILVETNKQVYWSWAESQISQTWFLYYNPALIGSAILNFWHSQEGEEEKEEEEGKEEEEWKEEEEGKEEEGEYEEKPSEFKYNYFLR